MKMCSYTLLLAGLVGAFFSSANADINGYTAQYECRAGNPNCDVDVVALGNRQCEQTITSSMPWSAIDWSRNTICIEAGDHTGKGTLTIPGDASGIAANYKVLRYTRLGDNDDDPWSQAFDDQAKLYRVVLQGADYWLIHRLTFPANDTQQHISRVVFDQNADGRWSSDVIVNRVLVEGPGLAEVCQGGIVTVGDFDSANHITVQNNVVRNLLRCAGGSPIAISMSAGMHHRIVNNQVYNWCEHEIQIGNDNVPEMRDVIIENNDLYKTSDIYDAAGNAAGGWLVSVKTRGTTSEPVRIVHNRLWGSRPQNGSLCGTPDSGHAAGGAANVGANNQFVVYQDNVITDSHGGIAFYNFELPRQSIVGNIFYDISPKGTTTWSNTVSFYSTFATEAYLNTVVAARTGQGDGVFGEWGGGGHTDLDIRCNVFLASEASNSATPGAGSVADFNVFYGSPPFTFNGANNNIEAPVGMRANSTGYQQGDVLQTAGVFSCTRASDAACFLYKVISAGTSAASSPAYCTALGCTTTDGSMTVQAVRGPKVMYRKLRTNPETYVIPYATVHTGADESSFCPSTFANRSGIGSNDDTAWNGIFAQDLGFTARNGTAGALQATSGGGGGGGNQTPFGGTPWPVPGLIEAEHFDDGGEGVAYHDTTTANEGAALRSTGVDIEPSSENGYNIGWTQSGEWVEYTVNVTSSGSYTLEFRVASAGPGGVVHLEVDGNDVTGPLTVPDTGGWQNWQMLTRNGVSLTAGTHIVRLAFEGAGTTGDIGNINFFQFTPDAASGSGTILRQYWTGIVGNSVTDLTSNSSYPDNPSASDQLTSFEAPIDWADNYGTRLHGYVHAPTTGNYTFWIAADDHAELWLSTDDNPNNKVLIASINGWTNSREWTKYPSQQSAPITLQVGQRYYIEALQKEGGGGDNLAVGWQLPSGTQERPIPGNRLSPWAQSGGGGGSNQSPYGGTPWPVPGLIEAEHYDEGGEGIAYYDLSTGNGGVVNFRTAENVDLYPSGENRYHIGWTELGEWLEYTINVTTTGAYLLDLRVASNGQGGNLNVEVDGADITGPIAVPDTGGWDAWQTITRNGINLPAGIHVLRIYFESAGPTGGVGGNINYFQFTPDTGATPMGTILRQYWTGIPGNFVTDLTSHPSYPNNPSGSDQLTSFEVPTDVADNYGTRVQGYVHAPTTGSYTFWIAADDYAELWLSSDTNASNKALIASLNGWTNSREWNKYASQQSAAITLQAGQRYYIEAIQKEGYGGDNLAVGWQLPDGTFERPIPGSRLSPVNP